MFLGFDIGTSGVKALLIDSDGRAIASSSASLDVTRPLPGWSEQAPADWWKAVNDSALTLARDHTSAMADVRGIGLSELDFQGRPFDLVINGISAGLSGSTGVELTDRIMNADSACYDLVYSSDDTPFLKMCRSLTDQRADGLGMLLAQAARQFELWTGLYPDPFDQLIAFGRSPDSCR